MKLFNQLSYLESINLKIMKKLILSTTAIAVTFVAFAFAPVEKNNAMDTNFVTNAVPTAGCDNFSASYRDATECWTKSTSETLELELAQLEVLNSY